MAFRPEPLFPSSNPRQSWEPLRLFFVAFGFVASTSTAVPLLCLLTKYMEAPSGSSRCVFFSSYLRSTSSTPRLRADSSIEIQALVVTKNYGTEILQQYRYIVMLYEGCKNICNPARPSCLLSVRPSLHVQVSWSRIVYNPLVVRTYLVCGRCELSCMVRNR